MSDNTAVYAGAMPSRQGELALEMHGMAPIPAENRYGSIHRVFTVWFAPNLVPAAFFVGVLALNLGFALGTAAIVLGTVLGALLVSTMCSWGPSTGLGQLPLARLQFGRTVFVPGLLMWLSTIAWDALNAIFGAAAIHLLIHVPFWIGLLIVLAMQGVLGVFGYEVMQTFEQWGSIVLGLMFVAITVKIAQIGNFHSAATVHGGPKVGAADAVGAALKPGWDALIALLAGFGAAVPFMDTSLFVGPASSGWLQGGDIAFPVGFVVALVVYAGIRWVETGTLRDSPRAAPVPSAAGSL